MKNKLKQACEILLTRGQKSDFFTPFIVGVYPLLFFYSNNFEAIASWNYFFFFTTFFIGIPIVLFSLTYLVINSFSILKKHKEKIIFVAIIVFTSVLLSQAVFLTIRKKMVLLIFIASAFLSFKYAKHYKKILILIVVMTLQPAGKCLIHIFQHNSQSSWITSNDSIQNAKFITAPNIYVIQPDGYVNQSQMNQSPYNHKTDFYSWLETNDFTLYDDFRSNYPASLASNSSMFAMKQHQFGEKTIINSIDVPKSRSVICGDNPVVSILKKNNYKTFFIVQDEYFQQGTVSEFYDYYNIKQEEIPFFSNDNNVKKDVFKNLKYVLDTENNSSPKFFFIEKLLPHHIHFTDTAEEERKTYLSKIEQVNIWLKKTIDYISKKDDNALIIVLADHGGWVDVENWREMFSTKDADKIRSIYSSIAAIKWNGLEHKAYDENLKTNVNVFRVLFSVLAQDRSYLEYLEDNSSYNLNTDGLIFKSKYQVIDNNGKVVFNKL